MARKPAAAVTEDEADTGRRSRDAAMHAPMHETRDATPTHADKWRLPDDFVWRPSSDAWTPVALPGMRQRWVRQQVDASDGNWARKWAEGWRPRAADTVPEHERSFLAAYAVTADGMIKRGNNILMQMSEDIWAQRSAHYRARIDSQTGNAKRELDAFAKRDRDAGHIADVASGATHHGKWRGSEIDETRVVAKRAGKRPATMVDDN